MLAWLDWFGLVLFDAALSTTLFFGAVLLPLLICRQPVRRILAERVALAASLLTLPLMASAAWPRFDVVQFVENHRLLDLTEINAADSSHSDHSTPPSKTSPRVARRRSRSLLMRNGTWLLRAGSITYAIGFLSGILWLLIGCLGIRWLIRCARLPSAPVQKIYDDLLEGRDPPRRWPLLLVCPRLARPVLAGLVNPAILIPPHLDSADHADALRHALLHELAHFDRRDQWHSLLANIAHSIWFFVPPVWWLRSQLLLDQEFVADRTAALQCGGETRYATSLLHLASLNVEPSSPAPVQPQRSVASGPSKAGSSPLLDRMLVLLHSPYRFETSPPRAWSWRLYLLIIALSLAVTMVRLRWPERALPNHQLHGPRSSKPHAFHVERFEAEPIPQQNGVRPLPYALPVALPDQFKLQVEVLTDTHQLSHLRVAGHRLAPPPTQSELEDSEGSTRPNWHTVEIERHGSEVQLHVNGMASWSDNDTATSDWLTLEPDIGSPIRFRNLNLTW